MIVHVTDIELARSMWPTVGPLLDKAVRRSFGCYELDDVWAAIEKGNQQLWVDWEEGQQINAAITTTIVHYPRKTFLRVCFVGGKALNKWFPEFRQLVESYAKKNNCSGIEGFLRKGWARVWPGARIAGTGLLKEF